MYEQLRCGNKEKITPVEMPEGTRELLREIMRQNALVIEANCMAMKLISTPLYFVATDPTNDG